MTESSGGADAHQAKTGRGKRVVVLSAAALALCLLLLIPCGALFRTAVFGPDEINLADDAAVTAAASGLGRYVEATGPGGIEELGDIVKTNPGELFAGEVDHRLYSARLGKDRWLLIRSERVADPGTLVGRLRPMSAAARQDILSPLFSSGLDDRERETMAPFELDLRDGRSLMAGAAGLCACAFIASAWLLVSGLRRMKS